MDGCNSPFEEKERQRRCFARIPALPLKTASPSRLQRRPSCNQFLKMEYGNLNLNLKRRPKAEFSKHVLSLSGLMMEKKAQKQKHVWCCKGTLTLTCGLVVWKQALQLSTELPDKCSFYWCFGRMGIPMCRCGHPFCKGTTNPASFGAVFPEMHATCWRSSQTP